MRKRLLLFSSVLFVIGLLLCVVNVWIGLTVIGLEVIASVLLGLVLLSNVFLKRTNWYKNNFVYTNQLCSNEGYRSYLIRNLDVVNVGSNPARFAFHYDNVLGENWSTGNQGLDMDFEILKFRHSFIKQGGVVLIPIIVFSSVSGCLRNNPLYSGIQYYAKFAHTLDPFQVSLIPQLKNASKWVRFPLFYQPSALRYLFIDVPPDTRLYIDEMQLMKPQLIEDARCMVEGWLKEFKLKSLDDPLSEELKTGFALSVETMKEMIDFLTERELQPVIVLTPMSEPLQRYFSQEVKQKYVYDFIDQIDRPSVRFLDYSNECGFQDPQLYFSSLFMNLRGRKLFTRRVLEDLDIVEF